LVHYFVVSVDAGIEVADCVVAVIGDADKIRSILWVNIGSRLDRPSGGTVIASGLGGGAD